MIRSITMLLIATAAIGCKKEADKPDNPGFPAVADGNKKPNGKIDGMGFLPVPPTDIAIPMGNQNNGGVGSGIINFGNGGGGAAVQGPRNAVGRTVDANDLQNLNIYIQGASLNNMPDAATILANLKQEREAGRLVKAIEEGHLVLTNIHQREGIWAYEKSAIKTGGMALSQSGVERLTAEELQARLKMQ